MRFQFDKEIFDQAYLATKRATIRSSFVPSVGAAASSVPSSSKSGVTPRASFTMVTAWKATKEKAQSYVENI